MSIFSKIIAGEIPAYKIAEDDRFLAFLDIFPLVEGHVLVIPKLEVDRIFDLDPQWIADAFLFAQKIGKAIERTFDCNRCGISVIGLEVPHAHIHLMPIDTPDDMNFARPKLKLDESDFKRIQQQLVAALNQEQSN
jgi:histidine triad (HIT) family protein